MIDTFIPEILEQDIHSADDLISLFWTKIFDNANTNISKELDRFQKEINRLHSVGYISNDLLKVLTDAVVLAQNYIAENGEPYAAEEDPYKNMKEC